MIRKNKIKHASNMKLEISKIARLMAGIKLNLNKIFALDSKFIRRKSRPKKLDSKDLAKIKNLIRLLIREMFCMKR
jgi:hypothetical protein